MSAAAEEGAVPRRRIVPIIGWSVLGVALAIAISFAWFLHLAGRPAEIPSHADGIVAFSGGQERVETALRLLTAGRADRLLLSGVGGGAELPELARLAGVSATPIAARVTIGRAATTTRGNAQETAAWVAANGIHSLLVVTAFYHMPRAMVELARALPNATLYPVPVRPGRFSVPLRLYVEEYGKYLAASVGITALLPVREAGPSHAGHPG